jgi:hypothetical protein
MLDLQDPKNMTGAAVAAKADTIEAMELMEQPDDTPLLAAPVARWFAFLLGGGLLTLGVAGFLATLTGHSTLFNLIAVDPFTNTVQVVSGLAGLAAWRRGTEAAGVAYAVAIMFLYVIVFTVGNLAMGNAADMPGVHSPIFLGLFRLHEIPGVVANALHITIAMAGLAVLTIVGLQQGGRATAKAGHGRVRVYYSRTPVRSRSAA